MSKQFTFKYIVPITIDKTMSRTVDLESVISRLKHATARDHIVDKMAKAYFTPDKK